MSTLKVDAIRHNSATSDAITTASDGTCTVQISSLNDSYIGGRRNMIINGDHRIAQRGTAAVTATTSASYRCVDRWKTDIDGSSGGDFSHAQSTDVPTGQGFTHSSKITTVTQASQPSGTSNRHQLYTMLEKYDVAHLEWGTSAAKTCTLSFWVKSSVTGTYILWLKHYGGTSYHYYTNYTIDSANTWEKKTITLTGYTSGGNVTGTLSDQGILIEWNLGTSSGNETGTLNEWTTSGDIRAASGSVYLPEHSGATWYLTGCQFEVGSVMTPFEHRRFADQLRDCQRYFQKSYNYDDAVGSSGVQGWFQWRRDGGNRPHIPLLTSMRSTPTFQGYNYVGGTAGQFRNASNGTNHAIGSVNVIGQNIVSFDAGATGWNQIGTGEVGFMYYSLESEL